METKDELKIYKDAGFEVNDVRTEPKRVAELARLRAEYGIAHQVTVEDLELNPGDDLTEGEWIFIPQDVPATTGTTEAPEGTVDPVQTEPEAEVTVSDTAKQDYFRGNAVIRVENRVQNGRVYKQVQTVTETYLVSEQEYVDGLTSK